MGVIVHEFGQRIMRLSFCINKCIYNILYYIATSWTICTKVSNAPSTFMLLNQVWDTMSSLTRHFDVHWVNHIVNAGCSSGYCTTSTKPKIRILNFRYKSMDCYIRRKGRSLSANNFESWNRWKTVQLLLNVGGLMNVWFTKNLSDAMLAWEELGKIKELFLSAYEMDNNSNEVAVFIRHESEGRLHCEVKVYFPRHWLFWLERWMLIHAGNRHQKA